MSTDRVVIVTGGSRGIGRATAIAAASRGFKICVGYATNEAAAREGVASIEAKNGKAIAMNSDVATDEVAGEGIRVAASRPGLIDTEIHGSGGDPDRAHRLAPMVPMKRVGSAEEIANAIVWLMSEDASYVTSAILDVSGGR